MLILLKNFGFNLKEIETPGFMRNLDEVSVKIVEEKNLSKTGSFFERSKNTLGTCITRHKKLLGEKESEFQEIIELLTQGMLDLSAENRDYNNEIYKQTENIKKLTQSHQVA